MNKTFKSHKFLAVIFHLHLQQSWKPIFVGFAVQSDTAVLPQEGKCELLHIMDI